MTKRERAAIIRAMELIHQTEDYDGGMAILARLAGIENSPFERRQRLKTGQGTIADLLREPNSDFHPPA